MQPEKFNAIITTGIIITSTVYILISYVIIRVNFKPIIDWANEQGASQYKDKFNMFNIVAYSSNPIIYAISNYLLTPNSARLTGAQISFLRSKILPNQTYNDETGLQQGIVTLRSLAISVLPDYMNDLSPDDKFNVWVDKTGKRGGVRVSSTNKKRLKYLEHSVKIDDDGAWNDGSTIYSYSLDPSCLDSDGMAPIWPTDDTISWKGLVYEWLNGTQSTAQGNTTTPQPNDSKAPLFYFVGTEDGIDIQPNGGHTGPQGVGLKTNRYIYWFGDDNKSPPADNWLSRMGMPHDSVLVLGYINDQYSIHGVVVDAQAFKNLVGYVGGDVSGGWAGFARGMGDDISYDQLFNLIQTTPEFTPTPAPKHCNKSAAGGVMGFFGPMLSAGLFAIATGGWGAVAMLGVGAVQGTMGAIQSQQC